jgi:iron complex transport system ATP-binding protein
MSDAVSFTGLGHAYLSGRWVFRDYAATIPKGCVFAVLGPNGRGKTTLLKVLLGTEKPSAGMVELNGQAAFVPQLFQVAFDYSVLDMVLMGRARRIGLFARPGRPDEAAAQAALDRVGMAHLAGQSFHRLSGGQRQLVILARALAAEADILVMDEPTSALDLANQSLVLERIRRLSGEDGLTVVLTTHHPHHALAVADHALLMLGEAEHTCGAAADVLNEANLLALYGLPLRRLAFEHEGRRIETFAPVFPLFAEPHGHAPG